MERDHSSPGAPETSGDRNRIDDGTVDRRSFLEMAGVAGGAAIGLGVGVGDAAADRDAHIALDYDEHGSATDAYSIERPGNGRFVDCPGDPTGKALELLVPENESWGTNATVDLPASGFGEPTELYQSIRMRLDADFAFREEGDNCRVFNAGLNSKWGVAGSGTNGPPTGTDGWSSRLYVLDTGARDGPFGLNVYTYHLDQNGGPGEEEPITGDLFYPGEWHDVETYVRLNTVDRNTANADGIVRVWVDGERVYNRENFRWTTDSGQGHHRVGPVAHWGGPEVPPRDSCIYYTDHQIRIGPDPHV